MPGMPAVALLRYLPISDADALIDVQLPVPEPGAGDLRVRVEAVGVNPVDTKVRAPKDRVESEPRVLGWDVAGVVDGIGAAVEGFVVGDRVFYAGDITRAGGNSRFHLVDSRIVGHMPHSLDFAAAAALPLTSITAYEALFERLAIDSDGGHAGASVLIVGGAGGVGSIGIQLAKIAGLTVIATASRRETAEWCRHLGADHVVDHLQPLRPQVEALGLAYFDYAANFNDTDQHWDAIVDLLKPQGRFVSIVENRGALDQSVLKTKSLTHSWEFMFTRAMFDTDDMIEQRRLLERVAAWVDQGRLRSTLSRTLAPINAASLREAHTVLEAGSMIGKLVVAGWPEQS